MVSEAEYLAFERQSDSKHEFLDGQIIAMTGASARHNLITASTSAALISAVRGQSCRVFSSDMRVRTPLHQHSYPDVSLVFGEPEYLDDRMDTLLNPTLIVEVLSPSTERFDRSIKFQNYWRIPGLQVYLLIAQDQARVERFTRHNTNEWLMTVFTGIDQTIPLPEIDGALSMADIYAQVSFGASESNRPDDPPPV